MASKICIKCKLYLPFQNFYKHPKMTSGRINQCKDCIKLWRIENAVIFKAAKKIQNDLRDGRLTRLPCFICHNVKSRAYQPDCSKPENILWVCSMHHAILKKEAKNG